MLSIHFHTHIPLEIYTHINNLDILHTQRSPSCQVDQFTFPFHIPYTFSVLMQQSLCGTYS